MTTISPASSYGAATRRAMRLLPYALSPRAKAPFQLAMLEVGLSVPFLLAYLYQVGEAQRRGEAQPRTKLISALAEAGITYGIFQNTKGVYPILAAAWTAYEMGIATTTAEKMKAALKGAVLFPLGYLGIHLGMSYSEGLHYRDAKGISEYLAGLKNVIDPPAGTRQPRALKSLQPFLKNLRASSDALVQFIEKGAIRKDTMPKIAEYIQNLETAGEKYLEKLNKVMPKQSRTVSPAVQKELKELSSKISTAQAYKGLRMMGPIFGYLLATTLVGIPVVKLISRLIFPQPASSFTDVNKRLYNIGPLWFDRVTGIGSPQDYSGEYLAPSWSVDGPGLISGASGGH